MVYVIITLFVISSLLYLNEGVNIGFRDSISKQINLIIVAIFFVSMLFIATFRPVTMPDSMNYINDFNGYDIFGRFELGYQLLRDSVVAATTNFRILFFVVALIALVIKFTYICKFAPYIYGSIVIYLSYLFVLHDMVQIRAGISSALLLWAIKYIYERRLWPFLLIVVVATLFHYSSLIILPLWFLPMIKLNKYVWLAIVPLCFVMTLAGLTIGGLVSYIPIAPIQDLWVMYQKLAERNSGEGSVDLYSLAFLLRFVLCAFMILYINTIEKIVPQARLWLMIYTISLVVYLVVSDVPVMSFRMSQFYQVIEFILVPTIAFAFRQRFVGKIIVIIFGAGLLSGSITNLILF